MYKEYIVIITVILLDKTHNRALLSELTFISYLMLYKDKLRRELGTFPTLVSLRISFLATAVAESYTANDKTHTDENGHEQP